MILHCQIEIFRYLETFFRCLFEYRQNIYVLRWNLWRDGLSISLIQSKKQVISKIVLLILLWLVAAKLLVIAFTESCGFIYCRWEVQCLREKYQGVPDLQVAKVLEVVFSKE